MFTHQLYNQIYWILTTTKCFQMLLISDSEECEENEAQTEGMAQSWSQLAAEHRWGLGSHLSNILCLFTAEDNWPYVVGSCHCIAPLSSSLNAQNAKIHLWWIHEQRGVKGCWGDKLQAGRSDLPLLIVNHSLVSHGAEQAAKGPAVLPVAEYCTQNYFRV